MLKWYFRLMRRMCERNERWKLECAFIHSKERAPGHRLIDKDGLHWLVKAQTSYESSLYWGALETGTLPWWSPWVEWDRSIPCADPYAGVHTDENGDAWMVDVDCFEMLKELY